VKLRSSGELFPHLCQQLFLAVGCLTMLGAISVVLFHQWWDTLQAKYLATSE